MLDRHHFWNFKDKDQRRHENEQEKLHQEHAQKQRTDEIAAHTHLDHMGRKGFLGLQPSFVRHTRNAIYARWVRGHGKP